MDGRVVINDGDLPFAQGRCFRSGSGIFDQVKDVILFGHWGSRRLFGLQFWSRTWAAFGMIVRNVVPCPTLESGDYPLPEPLADKIIENKEPSRSISVGTCLVLLQQYRPGAEAAVQSRYRDARPVLIRDTEGWSVIAHEDALAK